MKQLLGDKYSSFDTDLFRHLYYQRQPLATQRSLFIVKDKLSVEEIAQLADDFMATLPPDPSVASATVKPEADSHLTRRLDSRPRVRTPLRSKKRSRSTSRSASIFCASATSYGTCYYYRRLDTEARKCQSPCDFTTGPLNLSSEQ